METSGRLHEGLKQKAKEQFVITPRSFNKTLLFIPRDQYTPNFEVKLIDEKSGKEKVLQLQAAK